MAIRSSGYSPQISSAPTPRTNRPIVSGDYNLSENDLGVVLSAVGATCFLPAFTTNQLGREYGIKNGSTGVQTIQAAPGESILMVGNAVQSFNFNSDLSRQLSRETTANHWIIS